MSGAVDDPIFRLACRAIYILFSADVEIMETRNLDYIIRGLAHFFPPCELTVKTEARNAP